VCSRYSVFMERNDPDSAFPLYYRADLHRFFRLQRKHTDRSRRCTYEESMDISDIIATPVNVPAKFVPRMEQ
jgi:hypothetical protein